MVAGHVFAACSKCRTRDLVGPLTSHHPCRRCGGAMVVMHPPAGPFAACSKCGKRTLVGPLSIDDPCAWCGGDHGAASARRPAHASAPRDAAAPASLAASCPGSAACDAPSSALRYVSVAGEPAQRRARPCARRDRPRAGKPVAAAADQQRARRGLLSNGAKGCSHALGLRARTHSRARQIIPSLSPTPAGHHRRSACRGGGPATRASPSATPPARPRPSVDLRARSRRVSESSKGSTLVTATHCPFP